MLLAECRVWLGFFSFEKEGFPLKGTLSNCFMVTLKGFY